MMASALDSTIASGVYAATMTGAARLLIGRDRTRALPWPEWKADAIRFAERVPPGAFDIAVADPPYTIDAAERLVALFRRHPFASILSVEHPADRSLAGDETRRYGDTALTFCRAPAP